MAYVALLQVKNAEKRHEKEQSMAKDKRGRKLPKGIRQRYNGFEGRFMYKGERHLVHGETITETQKKMTELRYKLEHGFFVSKEKIVFDDWMQIWFEEYKKNNVKLGTYQTYLTLYNSQIKDKFGDMLLTEIRGEHIQKFYNGLIKEKYALETIKVIGAIINGSLKQAVKNHLIEVNPASAAEIPQKARITKKERTAMTKEQQELFMKYAKESYLYYFFAIMLRTGMRNGEMRALKQSDIDKKKGVIHVQRTLKHVTGEGEVEDTPKTKTSLRDIPLTVDILQYTDGQKKYWDFKIEKIRGYVFCDPGGKPLQRYHVQNEIDRIVKKIHAAGYDFPRITPHVFRHTFATRAIEAGMPPQVLKTILGHSSLAMTMDLYSHVLPDTKAEEMNKIADVF